MKFNKCKKLASAVGLAFGLTLAAGTAQSALLYVGEDDDVRQHSYYGGIGSDFG
jgi:hypothetical protein